VRRHATGCVELAQARDDATADVQVANGASVGYPEVHAIQHMAASESQGCEETEGSVNDPDAEAYCQDTYAVLDELAEQLAEACEEQTTWREEIDRQNLRVLLDDLDRIDRVKMLIQEIVDPLGKPSTDDPVER